jgi:anti-anti-sigma regulatory factor
MPSLGLIRANGSAVVEVAGELRTRADAEHVVDALELVPLSEPLVVDLAAVDALSRRAAGTLAASIRVRARRGNVAVVSTRPAVTFTLALAHPVATVVDSVAAARVLVGADDATDAADALRRRRCPRPPGPAVGPWPGRTPSGRP